VVGERLGRVTGVSIGLSRKMLSGAGEPLAETLVVGERLGRVTGVSIGLSRKMSCARTPSAATAAMHAILKAMVWNALCSCHTI
jgi:hypothetical protein